MEELALLDTLIERLDAAVAGPDDAPFTLMAGEPSLKATYRVTAKGAPDRKTYPADLQSFVNDDFELVAKGDIARGSPVETVAFMGKSSKGEERLIAQATVQGTRKVSGGYLIVLRATSTRKEIITPLQLLRDALARADAAGWERWCADLHDGPFLREADLAGANLSGFDLCCADLEGANLEGANLTGDNLAGADLTNANLDKARVSRADFFRARVPRRYAAYVQASGLPEIESVRYV